VHLLSLITHCNMNNQWVLQ